MAVALGMGAVVLGRVAVAELVVEQGALGWAVGAGQAGLG